MKPFDLLVYAIAALALIWVLLGVWNMMNPQETLSGQVQKALEKAQSSVALGKTVLIDTKTFPKETALTKGAFDTSPPNMSLALECNSPDICCPIDSICDKPLEWNYTMVRFKSAQKATLSARCTIQDSLPVCRVYFGEMPAQAKISCASITVQDKGRVVAKMCARNDGKNSLAMGTASMKLSKRVGEEFVETGEEFFSPETITLSPGQENSILFNPEGLTRGTYRATFRFEGLNAGFDTNTTDFVVGANTACTTDEKATSTQSMADGNYRELHYCAGCSYSYECLAAWMTKNPSIAYEPLTKEAAYCVKETYDGSC